MVLGKLLGQSPFVPGVSSIRGAFLGTVAIRGLSDGEIRNKGSKE